jgi:phosphohistidine phosphatase SixA
MRVVQALTGRGFAPNRVATSPYVRCRQTAEIISGYTLHEPAIDELDDLAPGSDLNALLKWSRKSECEQVCWVGHAPDVGNLTAALIGDSSANIRFAKGAVAAVRFDDELDAGAGELYWLVTARSLGL